MNKWILTAALGAITVTAPAMAQAPAQGQGGGWAQGDQTRDEAKHRADTMFQMLDANHDGTVTKAEAEDALAKFEAMATSDAGSGRGGGGRVRMLQQLVERLFATQPSITQAQLEALMLARFDAMDLNHDGVLTAAERQQYREQRAQARAQTPAPQEQ